MRGDAEEAMGTQVGELFRIGDTCALRVQPPFLYDLLDGAFPSPFRFASAYGARTRVQRRVERAGAERKQAVVHNVLLVRAEPITFSHLAFRRARAAEEVVRMFAATEGFWSSQPGLGVCRVSRGRDESNDTECC